MEKQKITKESKKNGKEKLDMKNKLTKEKLDMNNKKVNIDSKQEGCGNCIFCLSQCPECGSRNVSVRYKPEFEYSYSDGENSIHIGISDYWLEITCEDCGDYFESNSFSDEGSALECAISDIVNKFTEYSITRNEKNIEVVGYTFEKVEEKV